MKTTAFALVALSISAATAHADGFVCRTESDDLVIHAYNQTHASEGTRNAAVMVISDPKVRPGRRTIARFTDANETLTNIGASYESTVDLRFNDSKLKGRNIGGTKLGHLKSIVLDVDFSYVAPVADLDVLSGSLTLLKRDGQTIAQAVNCVRHLKSDQ
jgi:hypothetical protein